MNHEFDNVLVNKISSIERCLSRIHEEYKGNEQEFIENYTKQDAVILNLLRSCELSIDAGLRLIKLKKWQKPQSGKDVFDILHENNIIHDQLCDNLKKMIGFRNIAIHDYQKIDIEIVVSILNVHLCDFEDFINDIKSCMKKLIF